MYRCGDDECAASAGEHGGYAAVGQRIRGLQAYVDRAVPVFFAGFHGVARPGEPGVAIDHVQPAEVCGRGVDQRADVGHTAHVRSDEDGGAAGGADFLRGRLAVVGGHVGEHNGCAVPGEQAGGGASDSRRCAGDDGHPVCEQCFHAEVHILDSLLLTGQRDATTGAGDQSTLAALFKNGQVAGGQLYVKCVDRELDRSV